MLLGPIHGCKVTRPVDRDVITTDLPVYTRTQPIGYVELSAFFLLSDDGSVETVQLVSSSGDPEWDRAAVDSMMNWKFPPPPNGGAVWQKRTIRVDIIQSEIMNLGEITARSLEDAEILYGRLRAGVRFETLLRNSREESLVAGGRYLRGVDAAEFPLEVTRHLMALRPEQYTRPIEMHGEYYIFKRYGDNMPR